MHTREKRKCASHRRLEEADPRGVFAWLICCSALLEEYGKRTEADTLAKSSPDYFSVCILQPWSFGRSPNLNGETAITINELAGDTLHVPFAVRRITFLLGRGRGV